MASNWLINPAMVGWSSTTRIRGGRRTGNRSPICLSEPASGLEVVPDSGLRPESESKENAITILVSILLQFASAGDFASLIPLRCNLAATFNCVPFRNVILGIDRGL